jgi:predicted MFS family arabinose efflux permease
VGALAALERLPYLLVGLFVGVWVDRLRRRPVLMLADIGRGLLLLTIPLTALFGALRLEQLYVVAFIVGVLTVFFAVAYQSYLPTLVGRGQLMECNAKLETSRSAAEVAGSSLGGALIQALTAPLAIVVDALSYLVSGACLWFIRRSEPTPAPCARQATLRSIREGLRATFGHELLRPLVACSATMNLCYQAFFAVYLLYVTQALGLEAVALGAILAAGSAAGVLGGAMAGRVGRRFGVGPAIVGAAICSGVAGLAIPFADGPRPLVLAMLMLAQAVLVFGLPVYNVNAVSVRQALAPPEILGRVTASAQFTTWGAMPIGAALGGLMGQEIGLRSTLVVATAGLLLASLIVLRSPVVGLRRVVA